MSDNTKDYTKEELYNLIKKSPQEFKEWKDAQDEVDLSETDFTYLTLDGVDFSGVDLNGSSFADSHLSLINFNNADLTAVEFTRGTVLESDFSEAILTGADFSYATVHYGNFTDADMAGVIFQESDLTNSDFAGSFNLSACRFDEETIWPELLMLPEDFDATYNDDLSSLKDDEDGPSDDYSY